MKGRKKMSEIIREKFRRMRLILDKLEEHPMSLGDIERLIYKEHLGVVGKRTIQNYLAELKGLGLIDYSRKAGVYELTDKKQVFQSKHDYDLALKHSRILVFSGSQNQRLDLMEPFAALDLIVFHDIYPDPDIDNVCLFQHLKTGYFLEIYAHMQKYRQLMDEMGFSKRGGIPKIHFSEFNLSGNLVEKGIVQSMSTARFGLKGLKGKLKEIFDLRNLLVGKIYSVAKDVKHGIPLQGHCEHCPDRKITIKGSK